MFLGNLPSGGCCPDPSLRAQVSQTEVFILRFWKKALKRKLVQPMLCQANYFPEGTGSPPLTEQPLLLATSATGSKDLSHTLGI